MCIKVAACVTFESRYLTAWPVGERKRLLYYIVLQNKSSAEDDETQNREKRAIHKYCWDEVSPKKLLFEKATL